MATAFLKKLDRLLRDHFDGSSTELEPFPSRLRTKAGGFLVWPGFAGVEMQQRVRAVWDVLERGLTAAEMGRVALILPYTPTEMAVRREELAIEENGIQRAARVGTS